MSDHPTHVFTRLLDSVRHGDAGAADQLWSLVYEELHRMAQGRLGRGHHGADFQPTALVHEAYLRLMGNGEVPFENRRHFFAAAARAMHQILVDDARRRGRLKRGAASRPVRLFDDAVSVDGDPLFILAIDESLGKLGRERPDLVELVQLRFFAGLGLDDTAEVLGVSRRTVVNKWQLARTMLFGLLKDQEPKPPC